MQKKVKDQKGFTIIEVMIVLAIAALIMLIVFLAVPALQRSSRNNGRRTDASRLSAAVSSFVSNSDGTLPCTEGGATPPNDAQTIVQNAGQLGQFSFTSSKCDISSPSAPAAGNFTITNWSGWTNGSTSGPSAADNTVVVVEGATCNGGVPSQTSSSGTNAGARQAALAYPVETGGGYQWTCINAL